MDGKQALDFGASSDFPSLLRRQGLLGPVAQIGPMNTRAEIVPTESTTILAFKFSDGVLVAGDRRATSGNTGVSLWRLRACPRPPGKWPECSNIPFNFFAERSCRR